MVEPFGRSSSSKFFLKPAEASNVLLRSLQRLYSEKKLFDVSISCNGNTLFGCHKLVLASCSSYFERLLSTTDGYAILNLDAVDGNYVKHLHTIVNYMYGHNVVISKTGVDCRQLYEAARIFGATALIKTMDIQLNSVPSKPTVAKVRKRVSNDPFDASNSADQDVEEEVVVLKPCGIGSMLLVNFQRFKHNGKFIDAKICCRDQLLFACHKLVLASFSAYFESLLSNTEGSAILNLDAVDSLYVQQLSTLIEYMYGKPSWVKTDDFELLQDAAHVFGVQSLERGELARQRHAKERNRVKRSLACKLDKLRNESTHEAQAEPSVAPKRIHVEECGIVQSAATDQSFCQSTQVTSEQYTETPLSSVGAVEEISSEPSGSNRNEDLPTNELECGLAQSTDSANSQHSLASKRIRSHVTSSHGLLSSFDLCYDCGKTFRRRADGLQSHSLKHDVQPIGGYSNCDSAEDERIKCAECPAIYDDVSSLRSHWEASHGSRHDRRGCFECGLVFSSSDTLRMHAATCLESTEEKSRYRTGIVQKLLCKACGYSATSLEAFIRHADAEHISNEPHCHICDRAFPDRQALNDHYGEDHAMPLHLCPICGKSFKTLPGYKYHLDTHEPIQQCSMCTFTTSTSKNLEMHVKKYHPSASLATDSEPAAGAMDHMPHKCTDCPAAFLYECLLIRHYRSKHLKLKPFMCPYCGHATSDKAALQTHIRCVHTKECPFTCEVCGFKCKTYSILSRHRKVHTGEKPHVCEQCGAGFPEKRDLTAHHWKVHLKRQPFSCPLCNVGFFRKDNLLQHQRSKHGASI